MLIQEIFNQYDAGKVEVIANNADLIEKKVTLKSGKVLLFTATTQGRKSRLHYGDPIWEIQFSVDGSYGVQGGSNISDTGEVFSFVLQFLQEMKDAGCKGFYFSADDDHLSAYLTLVKRFGRGMKMYKRYMEDGFTHFILATSDFKVGFVTFIKPEYIGISFPSAIGLSIELDGVVLSGGVEDGNEDDAAKALEVINDLDSSVFGVVGELLSTDKTVFVKYDSQISADEFRDYFGIDSSDGPYFIDSHAIGQNKWSYTYIDEENFEHNETATYVRSFNSWDLYLAGVPEAIQYKVISTCLSDIRPDVLHVYDSFFEAIPQDDDYHILPEESDEITLIKKDYEIPITVEDIESGVQIVVELGKHSFQINAFEKDGETVISSKTATSDDNIANLLEITNLAEQIAEIIRGVGDGEYDTSDLSTGFIEVLGRYLDF